VALHKVWITLPNGENHEVGDIAFGQPTADGRCPSAFRYSPTWQRRGFALDPESLPLRSGEFQSSHLAPPLAVLSDALPDAWGQHIIDVTRSIPIAQRTQERYLVEVGGRALGALGFHRPVERFDPKQTLSLDALAQAAMDLNAGREVDLETARLFAHGASAGGARPKVVTSFEEAPWIAKLPSPHQDRGFDVPLLEYVSMQIVGECLPSTPETRLKVLAGRNAVLIRRFDVTGNGRHHQLSFSTLGRERVQNYASGYDDLARILTKHSADPREDLRLMFTQVVLNAALGNTDDHLKNFMMQRTPAGYRLSPPFDIVPNIGRNLEHVLSFGPSRYAPERQTLMDLGVRWQLEADEVAARISQVTERVATFSERLAAAGGNLDAHSALLKDIATRTARLAD
jgi:serine/threonine-protein kinase HipA